MLITIPDLLSKDEVSAMRADMDKANWIDGKATAGEQSGAVKHNQQLKEGTALANALGDKVLDALARNETFVSASLPLKIFPPLFNRYQGGGHFGQCDPHCAGHACACADRSVDDALSQRTRRI